MSLKLSRKSSTKLTSSDVSASELIQLQRDVNRQFIRDRMHLSMAEQLICSERLHIKQFAKDVEGEIFRTSGYKLDAIYYFKFNSILMNIRRIDCLENIVIKVISAKKLVSMSKMFSCLKCGGKSKPYSVFCSGNCIRLYGHSKTTENGGKKHKKRSKKTQRVSVVQKIPASLNPVVKLKRISKRSIDEILQAGLRANRHEPPGKLAIKLEESCGSSVNSSKASVLQEIRDEVGDSNSCDNKLPILCRTSFVLLEKICMEPKITPHTKYDVNKSRTNQRPNVDNEKSKERSRIKERSKSVVVQNKSHIVQMKPKPIPSKITVKDERKYIQKTNETTVQNKPILKRRHTSMINDASSNKNRRRSTIDESKPAKIEKRRKSIIDSMKAMKSNKVRPKVYQNAKTSQTPTKSNKSEIDESRAKIRQLFKKHLEQRTVEQLQITPYMNQLTENETLAFARKVEQEMFDTFGYTNNYFKKHRELVFNILNRNNNLFLDISRRLITPQRLVHMTSDELVCPKYVEERENIERHNLDLIAESVADQLAHPPVLFRRSDEEVHHTSKPINVDRNTSARDLLTAYNNVTGVNLGESSSYTPVNITQRRITWKNVPSKY